jgi:hypothetical protein
MIVMSNEPRADLGPFSGSGANVRPWSYTVDALRRSQKFILCTVRADGRPHATPLLAVWAMDGMCFGCGENEQKAKNLASNPKCILMTGTDTLTGYDYVVEGTAELVVEADRRDTFATEYEQAYGWHVTREDGTWYGMPDMMRSGEVQLYLVRPTIVFAFGNGEPFGQTRYRFQ